MYDNSAPYPTDNYNSPLLHYLVVNIRNDILDGNTVVKYMPPNPPVDSDRHTYTWVLYKQYEKIWSVKIEERKRFNLEDYVERNRLKVVDVLNIRVAE